MGVGWVLMADEKIILSIKDALKEINKELQLHEGGVALIDFKDGVAYLEFQGSCGGCPASECGVIANLEQKLISAVENVKKVVVL